MKKTKLLLSSLVLVLALQSCNKEKQLEEVQVPLPENTEEKTTSVGNPDDVAADPGTFKMMKLPYKYDALEPHIDAKTVEIHYSKHHVGYVNNLNKAIAGTALEKQTIEEILEK